MADNWQNGVSGGGSTHGFEYITSEENILRAWRKFKKSKMKKTEVRYFDFFLEKFVIQISDQLKSDTWIPLPYREFFVHDPKKRHIHSAEVIDRVVQQAVFQCIEPLFDRYFIYDSYSSRCGTHKAVNRVESFLRKVTTNYTKQGYVLKCDIIKFFDSIDHMLLKQFIKKEILDKQVVSLIFKIIDSFETQKGKGLPLGNVTSQLFCNIYMHRFDHFVKHTLRAKYYARYCDDFVIVHPEKQVLENFIYQIEKFLSSELALVLHPRKREIRKISQGIDFLGYVLLPHYRVLRTNTKRRIIRKYRTGLTDAQKISYEGVLSHASEYTFKKSLL